MKEIKRALKVLAESKDNLIQSGLAITAKGVEVVDAAEVASIMLVNAIRMARAIKKIEDTLGVDHEENEEAG